MTMRQKANYSLIALTIAFIVIVIARYYYGQNLIINCLLFVVEAGMVGALADWFAVTALFRHPLGMKFIPHTAIVPKNKNTLIEGVVTLVEEQLLDRNLIAHKLNEVNLVRSVIDAIGEQPFNKIEDKQIKNVIVKLSRSVVTQTNIGRFEQMVEALILKSSPTKWLVKIYELARKNEWDKRSINKLLDVLHKRLSQKDVLEQIKLLLTEETKQKTDSNFFTRLLFQAAQAINAVNIDDAAEIIYKDLLQLVTDLKDEEHELRKLIDRELVQLAELLKTKEDLNTVLQIWIINMIAELKLQAWLPAWLMQFIEQGQTQDTTKLVEMIIRFVKKAGGSVWTWFISDEPAQQKVESYIKNFVSYLLQYEYKVVGEIVRATLNQFTDERLVEFIESKVETDLQRIRLNGALIGATLGALIYGFLYGIYTPILQMF